MEYVTLFAVSIPSLFLWHYFHGYNHAIDGTFPTKEVLIGLSLNGAALVALILSGWWRVNRAWMVYFTIGTAGFALSCLYPELALTRIKI